MREGTEGTARPESAPSPGEPLPSDEPPSSDHRPPDRGTLGRSVALGVVAFVATLVLLVGFSTLLTRSGQPTGAGPSASTGVGSASGAASGGASPGPSGASAAPTDPPGDPVLVGAGDIAECSSDGDTQTAALLDTI